MGLDQGPLSLWASLCSSVNGARSTQAVWALGAALLGPESGPPHPLVLILCLATPVPPVAAIVRVLGIGTHGGLGGQFPRVRALEGQHRELPNVLGGTGVHSV